jgi:hypothetical protein
MDVMSVRIDTNTRRRMAVIDDVNWAEVIRDMLKERLELEEELRRSIDHRRALRGSREADRIRRKLGTSRFDSTKEVRRWRDSRK